jgi:hypothetical protein
MMSNWLKIAIGLAILVGAVVLFVVLARFVIGNFFWILGLGALIVIGFTLLGAHMSRGGPD